MEFSKTELLFLSELGAGNTVVVEIAKALKISVSQVYRIIQIFQKDGILHSSRGVLQPEMKTHVSMLLKILSSAKNLAEPLSGTGLTIYLTLLTPKTIKHIEKETGLHKTTVFKKIHQGRKMSLLTLKDKTYVLNDRLWPEVKECLLEIKKYEESVDKRVPLDSIIYFKNSKEILFSNRRNIDAKKTAFSAYENFGIKLLLITHYYYLPQKKLTREQVFRHSLFVVEKSLDRKHFLFVALFFLKYKKELFKISHPIVQNLQKVLFGERIAGYPTLAEIKNRASVYKIRM